MLGKRITEFFHFQWLDLNACMRVSFFIFGKFHTYTEHEFSRCFAGMGEFLKETLYREKSTLCSIMCGMLSGIWAFKKNYATNKIFWRLGVRTSCHLKIQPKSCWVRVNYSMEFNGWKTCVDFIAHTHMHRQYKNIWCVCVCINIQIEYTVRLLMSKSN